MRRWRWALVAAITLTVVVPLVVINLPADRYADPLQSREAVKDVTRPPTASESPAQADGTDTRADVRRVKPRLGLFTGAVNYIPLLTLLLGGGVACSARYYRDSGVSLIIHGLVAAAFGVMELFMIYATRAAAQAFLPGAEAGMFAQYADLLAAASALTLVAVGVNVFTQGLLLQDRPEEINALAEEVRKLRGELRAAGMVNGPTGR